MISVFAPTGFRVQLAGAPRTQPAQPLQRVQEHASVAQTGPEEHLHSALPGRWPDQEV